MLICQCKWLTYNQLCDVVDSGARSVEAIQQRCGAGTECGGCVDVLQRLVDSRLPDGPHTRSVSEGIPARLDIDAA